ncbi:SDR family oxidoreductase [Mucilaginibacter mali]|uniref:SDR family oxidoreductase n=1 Tax=Mucilaginibacter mali TaxID=2740462 RepID=A0A7D4QSA7_9SPHI|nr:SDR family oxidoreductase [Mucilaginibacter mali]QKJ29969.1 SDR family oxidoreductase [Mucilaginibacter mali]
MRVFVTGASGFIGSAVVQELINSGHTVLGLARSEGSAKSIKEAGADVHYGDLQDLDSLRSGAAQCDGVIHLGFIHDFSKFAENCETDRKAIAAMGATLAGSYRPIIITSGSALLAGTPLATEDMKPAFDSKSFPRVASEEAAAELVKQGIRASVVRLPPSVHGNGDHGFVPMLITLAREKGATAYIGDGANRWPAVHRFDAARLFRLALEKAAIGVNYHAIDDDGIPMSEIAGVIGCKLSLPVVSKTKEEAGEHFSWMAHFAALDNPASSAVTREQLDWEPKQKGLLEDLENGTYFN